VHRSVGDDHVFPCALRILQDRSGQSGFIRIKLLHVYAGGGACGCYLGLDPLFDAAYQRQDTAIGARVFERSSHQNVDQPLAHGLARHRLRNLDHRGEIELLHRCRYGGGMRGALVLPQIRIAVLELPYLAVGFPSLVTTVGIAKIVSSNPVETACLVEAGRKLIGQRFMVEKAVLARRANSKLVLPHGLEVPAVDSGVIVCHAYHRFCERFGLR
jgi:hypothetical protein